MSRDFKLLICSLNWTLSDTTGHDTGLGTGLSLAALLFDGKTDFVKGEEIMILANCRSKGLL